MSAAASIRSRWGRHPGANRDERGFVLLAVLWLLVALGAVGVDAGLRGRSERLAAANSLDHARAVAAARAGSEYARSRLSAAMLDQANTLRQQAAERNRGRQTRAQSVQQLFRSSPVDDPWRFPEELMETEKAVGDAAFRLMVRDTGAALNLNEADELMLRNFFSLGLRLDYALSNRITQAVLDWRDEDDIPRVGGGERLEYIREGLAVLPTNGPFAGVEELANVLGMTEEALDLALPHLSVIGSGRINVNAAPEEVLLAVPGMTREAATQMIRDREAGTFTRTMNDLFVRYPSVAGDEELEERLEDAITFSTSEVEVQSVGGVVGSPVSATVHVVVTRAEEGALVVWRSIR